MADEKRPARVTAANQQANKARKGKPRERTRVLPPAYLEPWEKQPGESRSRYEAFLVYRDQPAHGQLRRSLERAAHACGKSPSTLEQWSREDHWRERVSAWDRHLQAVKDAAKVRELERIGERQAQQLAAATASLQAPIVGLLQRIERRRQLNPEDPWEGISDVHLAQLAIRAARAIPHVIVGERLVQGQSTSNVDAHVTVSDERRDAEAMPPVERERLLLGEGVDDGREQDREKARARAAGRDAA
jgi:hypothetical protein